MQRWMGDLEGRALGLAALSGLLQVLPYPIAGPVPLWREAVAWFALSPLLWALTGGREKDAATRPGGWRRGAALGYLSGVIWYGGSCYWIYQTMYLYGGLSRPVAAGILVLFCLYLGLYHAVFGAAVAAVRRTPWGRQGALLLAPVVWVAVELLRARVTGFPWDLLGITQVDSAVLRRLAPVTGVYGISFVVAAVNALWILRIEVRERRWTRPALAAAGVLVIVLGVLSVVRGRRLAERGGEQRAATLLQENLEVGAAATGPPESEGALLGAFAALSERPSAMLLAGTPERPGTVAVRRRREMVARAGGSGAVAVLEPADVVVWPESPAPFEEGRGGLAEELGGLARTMRAPLIVGSIGLDRSVGQGGMLQALYNSALFVRPDGSMAGRYDKMHLVPFGEYVPFKRLFFFAGHLLDEVGTFVPGGTRRVFVAGGHSYGVFICYESIFGDEVREFVRMGADVLVNISNDGWYGDTSAPWQHLNMVRMRAVETHRWVLRATNTGVTAAIDPEGRVVAAAPRHVRTAVRVPFFYEHDQTFYVRHGDWFAWLCLLGAAGGVGWGEVRQRRQRVTAGDPLLRRMGGDLE